MRNLSAADFQWFFNKYFVAQKHQFTNDLKNYLGYPVFY